MTNKSFFERLTGATAEETAEFAINGIEEKKKKVEAISKAKPTVKTKSLKKEVVAKIEEVEELEQEVVEEPTKNENGAEGQLVIDVYQTDSDIVIKSTIAGVKTEDLEMTIVDNTITVKGVRKKDSSIYQGDYYYQEIYWGSFSRSVILPVDVDADKTRAAIKNGVLTIKVPKIEKSKIKTIKIKTLE